jgi:anti-sigma B factor antagonist
MDEVAVVEISGRIDAASAPEAQAQIAPHLRPGIRMLVRLGKVKFLSSAGLRMLLLLHRDIHERRGVLALVGLSDDVRDVMSITGFLEHFTVYETLEDGLREVRR